MILTPAKLDVIDAGLEGLPKGPYLVDVQPLAAIIYRDPADAEVPKGEWRQELARVWNMPNAKEFAAHIARCDPDTIRALVAMARDSIADHEAGDIASELNATKLMNEAFAANADLTRQLTEARKALRIARQEHDQILAILRAHEDGWFETAALAQGDEERAGVASTAQMMDLAIAHRLLHDFAINDAEKDPSRIWLRLAPIIAEALRAVLVEGERAERERCHAVFTDAMKRIRHYADDHDDEMVPILIDEALAAIRARDSQPKEGAK